MTTADAMSSSQSLLERLVIARRSGVPLDHLACRGGWPVDEREAYDTAEALGRAMGWYPVGFKVGANGTRSQALLGLTQPLYGRCIAEQLHHSPARFVGRGAPVTVEAELVLRLGRGDHAYLPDAPSHWVARIDRVVWGLEINQPSYVDPIGAGGLAIIADNGVHAGLVLGAPLAPLALEQAAQEEVTLCVGDELLRGSAVASGIDPLAALDWLGRTRAAMGQPLQAGDWVATGAIVSMAGVPAGSELQLNQGGHAVATLSLVETIF